MNYQNDIRAKIQHYIGERDSELGGKKEMVLRQLQQQEGKYARIAPNLNHQAAYQTKTALLQELQIQFKEERQKLKQLQQILLAWNDQQATRQKDQERRQAILQELQLQLATHTTNETHWKEQVQQVQQKIDNHKKEISQTLNLSLIHI